MIVGQSSTYVMMESNEMTASPVPPLLEPPECPPPPTRPRLFERRALPGLRLVVRFSLKKKSTHSHSWFAYETKSQIPLHAAQRSLQDGLDEAAAASQKMNITASMASWPKMNQGRILSGRVGPVDRSK